jgi:hypothetical protein
MDASENPRRDPEQRRFDRIVRGYSWFYAVLALVVIAIVVALGTYGFGPLLF